MLSNKELRELVIDIYDNYSYSVDSYLVDRFIDNYENKVNYHKLLLNGKDKIEIEVARNVEDLINEVSDYMHNNLPITFCYYYSSTFDIDSDVIIDKKGKIFIKGIRLHKYISDIHKGYRDYLNKAYANNHTSADKDIFMYSKYVSKDALDVVLQKLTIEAMVKVVISARPDDFILCSEKTTGWQSCFRVEGEYHNSTNSFYCDNRFLVSYILSSSGRKVGRRWLHIDYDEEIVSTGKPYGTYGMAIAKNVREYIQKLIDPKDTWVSYENDCNYTDACGVYCDIGYRTSYKKSNGKPNNWSIYSELPDGLNCYGNTGSGTFNDNSYICPDCGDRFDYEDGYFIEDRGESICPDCGSSNYFWCDGYDRYVAYDEDHIDIGSSRYSAEYALNNGYAVRTYEGDILNIDEAVYLEDTDEWVHESEEHYCDDSSGHYWSMDYFREYFVLACDTCDFIHKDNANYSEILDAYFEDYTRMEEAENEKRD